MRHDGGRMRLPVREQRAARIEAIDRLVDDTRSAWGDDRLAWACLPHLVIFLRSRASDGHKATPFSSQQAADLWSKVRTNPMRPTTLAQGHLFFAFSDNQRLAQAPIAERLGRERPAPEEVDVSAQREEELVGRANDLVEALIETARLKELELPVRRRQIYRLFLRAVRDLTCWEALLGSLRPASATIGSTHSAASRTLALACREANVPCVYVPHAPALSEARLADLPVDWAGLRGPAEVSYYAEFGGDSSRMRAIGNPGVEPDAVTAAAEGDGPCVFALPTDDDWALEQLVTLVFEALGDGVVASPHPRADREALHALLPAGWELWEGRTFDLLRRGARALIQASSGVGLEGLALGIPTIELAFPGEAPNYPYLRDPEVVSVSEAQDLRDAVEAASRLGGPERERIRERAREWVSAEGSRAAEAGAELIGRAAAEGVAATPVWDAWEPGNPSGREPISAEPGPGASDAA
jgi:hypothetical protein